MPRTQRSSKLETRSARATLPIGKRVWVTLGRGVALAYRRTSDKFGTWQGRAYDAGDYKYENLGRADDFEESDGKDILTFIEAQQATFAFARSAQGKPDPKAPAVAARDDGKPHTVATAAADYLAWYAKHRKAFKATEAPIRAHILPALGSIELEALTATKIRDWHEKLAESPARVRVGKLTKTLRFKKPPETEDKRRARRASANRVLSVLKAMLNRAFQSGYVTDDRQWRMVKPFPKVDEARIRFLTDAESMRLVNACSAELKPLVHAALLTGCRYGELVQLRAGDVHVDQRRVYIAHSKSGKPRHIPLNPEGAKAFERFTVGKTGDDLVFTRADGAQWGKNHHVRGVVEACKAAKIRPAIRFHELRHTYASHLAQAGVDLLTISKLLGHADTRITSRHYAHLADRTLVDAVQNLPTFQKEEKTNVVPMPAKRARKQG